MQAALCGDQIDPASVNGNTRSWPSRISTWFDRPASPTPVRAQARMVGDGSIPPCTSHDSRGARRSAHRCRHHIPGRGSSCQEPVQVFWSGASRDHGRDADAQRFRRAPSIDPFRLTLLCASFAPTCLCGTQHLNWANLQNSFTVSRLALAGREWSAGAGEAIGGRRRQRCRVRPVLAPACRATLEPRWS